LARLYEKTLTHDNFQVRIALSAAEAIEALTFFDPDVIFLDWALAGNTGAEVLDVIQELPPEYRPQVTIVSGQYEHIDLSRYKHLIYAMVPKPITIGNQRELAMAMSALSEKRQLVEETHINFVATNGLHIMWRGRTKGDTIFSTIQNEIAGMVWLVMDVWEVTATRLDIQGMLRPLPADSILQRVYMVNSPSQSSLVRYLMSFFPMKIEISTNLTRTEAEKIINDFLR
jgi:CheY-like chemotaxis protein